MNALNRHVWEMEKRMPAGFVSRYREALGQAICYDNLRAYVAKLESLCGRLDKPKQESTVPWEIRKAASMHRLEINLRENRDNARPLPPEFPRPRALPAPVVALGKVKVFAPVVPKAKHKLKVRHGNRGA